MKVHGTNEEALSDSGAIPNLLLPDLTHYLSLEPIPAKRKVTVANWTTTIARGILHEGPVKFGSFRIPLEFLVVEKSPFAFIFECPTLEKLGALH